MSDLDDIQLTALLRTGNEAAFTEIYNRYWHKLLGLAYNHLRDKTVAEEILQEVFFSLWNRRGIVDIHSLSGYLATAIKFSIFKHQQRLRRHLDINASDYTSSLASQDEDEIEAKFLKEYIDGVVEQLPKKCQLVFKFSREEGMKIPEIASEMNIAEKTVEAHLTKALKTIRLNLKASDILALLVGIGIYK